MIFDIVVIFFWVYNDIKLIILYKENIFIYLGFVDVILCVYMFVLIRIVVKVIKYDIF